jgi:hypothetical protein
VNNYGKGIYSFAGSSYTVQDIRAWARAKGLTVSDRGRLSSSVIRAFAAEKNGALPRKPVRRSVLAGKAVPKRGDKVKKPGCPVHKVAMTYSEGLGMWLCTEDGCRLRAHPADGGTKPLIGTGKISLIRERKGHTDTFYLRSDNGVLLDISRVMGGGFTIENDGSGPVATLELILNLE